jgi:post-segregation antitoxin (ccd killing protein)
MEVTVKVPERLAEEARARGVPVPAYIEELLSERAADATEVQSLHTEDEIRTWLDSLAQLSDKIPPLPETISREWIYQDHD